MTGKTLNAIIIINFNKFIILVFEWPLRHSTGMVFSQSNTLICLSLLPVSNNPLLNFSLGGTKHTDETKLLCDDSVKDSR